MVDGRHLRPPDRAAVEAPRSGRVVAYVLIVVGLVEFLTGSVVGRGWMAFIGRFLFAAPHHEETEVLTRQSLSGCG